MAKSPQLTGAEVIRRLKRLGFEEDHRKGSHVVMRSSSGRTTVVPNHGGKAIKKGTLHAIVRQADISLEQLIDA